MKPDTYKNRWLRKLLAAGLRPIQRILCEAEEWEDINEIERDFVRWLKEASRLTNGTPGGDGGSTPGRKLPPRGPSPMRGVKWLPDDPRREAIRKRQLGIEPIQASLQSLVVNRKRWRITDPFGVSIEVIGLSEFCRARGLSASKMAAVARRSEGRTHHKGYRCERCDPGKQ